MLTLMINRDIYTPRRNNDSVTNTGANNNVSDQTHLGSDSLQFSIKTTTIVTY